MGTMEASKIVVNELAAIAAAGVDEILADAELCLGLHQWEVVIHDIVDHWNDEGLLAFWGTKSSVTSQVSVERSSLSLFFFLWELVLVW